MFNQIVKTMANNVVKEKQNRLELVMDRIVDIFNEEKLTVEEMGILIKSMEDGYKLKIGL